MKSIDKRSGRTRFVPLLALLALGVGIAGCSGDDGKDGAAGPSGPPGTGGPAGPTGPTGPAGTVDLITTATGESCIVCHDGVGGHHQAEYNRYADASKLARWISGDEVASLVKRFLSIPELRHGFLIALAEVSGVTVETVITIPAAKVAVWLGNPSPISPLCAT